MKRILTIAGSDSGGGAGIQADLKVITLLGCYGMSAITALTAQNTKGVQAINVVSAKFVEAQIDSVISDIGADVLKIGMLANAETIEAVVKKIKQYKIKKIVLDPVMVAKSGDFLLQKDAIKVLIKKLIPLAFIITPNILEASVLSGLNINSVRDMKKAARQIYALGAKYVVVKGGHLKRTAVDVFYDGKKYYEIEEPKINTKNTHGTGCTFSSAIAGFWAKGETVFEAVKKSKKFITMAIKSSFDIGEGKGPTNPYFYFQRDAEKYQIIQELKQAAALLKEKKIGHLIPEVASNLGYALPYAESIKDIAAFPLRIVGFKDTIAVLSEPEFGASCHIAKIIFTVMKFNPEYRCAMNIRYSKEIIMRLKKQGFLINRFDRKLEPKEIKQREGSSLEWGVGEVLRNFKKVPDFIYDEGDIGKEPMIRVLGKNPMDIIKKLLFVPNYSKEYCAF